MRMAQPIDAPLDPKDARYIQALGQLAMKYVELSLRVSALENTPMRRLKRRVQNTHIRLSEFLFGEFRFTEEGGNRLDT